MLLLSQSAERGHQEDKNLFHIPKMQYRREKHFRFRVSILPVSYTHLKIVAYLAQNSGKVITYASILSNVWGPYADNDNKILRVNMANIRRKIEEDPAQPQYIFTEVGVGYRMAEDEDE